MQNTAKQNYPGSVAFYDVQPVNEVGLFYYAPKPTWGTKAKDNDNDNVLCSLQIQWSGSPGVTSYHRVLQG